MESEEARLLKIFREKYGRRERREERRRERIEHLKRLIAEIPSDPEDSRDEEEKRIKEEIREAETRFNKQEETKKVFRVAEKVYDEDGEEVAIINATVDVQINRKRINFNRQGILVSTLMKENKAKSKTQLLGDINVDKMINFQLEMQDLPDEELPEEMTTEKSGPQSMEIAVPVAETGIRQTNVSMEVDQESSTNLPDETCHPCPVDVREEVVQTSKKSPETIREKPAPLREQSRKRVRTYTRKRQTSSDSTEETSEEERRKRKRATGKRKTVAKDGRKLADVSNRLRNSRGRLLGYKPGTATSKRKPIRKAVVTASKEPETHETPENQRENTIQPVIQEEAAKRYSQLIVTLDPLKNSGAERARSMRPSAISGPEAALTRPEEVAATQKELDEGIPSTQSARPEEVTAQDGATAQSGGDTTGEQLVGLAEV